MSYSDKWMKGSDINLSGFYAMVRTDDIPSAPGGQIATISVVEWAGKFHTFEGNKISESPVSTWDEECRFKFIGNDFNDLDDDIE